MTRETPSPIDLPDAPVDAEGLGWSATWIAIAAIFLFAFNAASLRDWADDLTPGPWQQRLATACEAWADTTEALGIAAPRAWLHDLWKKAEAARFGDGTRESGEGEGARTAG